MLGPFQTPATGLGSGIAFLVGAFTGIGALGATVFGFSGFLFNTGGSSKCPIASSAL